MSQALEAYFLAAICMVKPEQILHQMDGDYLTISTWIKLEEQIQTPKDHYGHKERQISVILTVSVVSTLGCGLRWPICFSSSTTRKAQMGKGLPFLCVEHDLRPQIWEFQWFKF